MQSPHRYNEKIDEFLNINQMSIVYASRPSDFFLRYPTLSGLFNLPQETLAFGVKGSPPSLSLLMPGRVSSLDVHGVSSPVTLHRTENALSPRTFSDASAASYTVLARCIVAPDLFDQ